MPTVYQRQIIVSISTKRWKMKSYTCPNCGEVWTENELYKELANNEDWVILVTSCKMCPYCYIGDLY
jgi:hypothetical protein